MSIQAVSFVLEHSDAEHGDRLVLISLANHAHPDGTHSFPTVPTLMHEARLTSRRAVQYALTSLSVGYAGSGVAIVETGRGPNGARMWTVLMDEQARTFRSTPRKILVESGGALSAPPAGRINEQEGGALTNTSGAQKEVARVKAVPEPSTEPAPQPPLRGGADAQLILGPALTLVPVGGRSRQREQAAAERAEQLAAYIAAHPPRPPDGRVAEFVAQLTARGGAAIAYLEQLHVHEATDAGLVLGAPREFAGWIRDRYVPAVERALAVPVRVLDCGCAALDARTA